MPSASPPTYYFDDEDEGPSPATSHPTYVKAFPDDFFYSCVEEFGPFGSDAGADTLAMLEEWFQEPRPGSMKKFVARVMKEWEMKLPDLTASDEKTVLKWLKDDELETALYEIDALVIATAFGQLKITGSVEPEAIALAEAGARRKLVMAAYQKQANPAWAHADEMIDGARRTLAALAEMRTLARS